MQRSSRPSKRLPLSLLFYRLLLHAYPVSFRRAFGDELWQTFRDTYEEANTHGQAALALLWLHTSADVLRSALPERLHIMRPTILLASILTGIAFVLAFISSFNLYGLEDHNPLVAIAYQASPLLRFTYDGTYVSALVAGLALCALIAYAIFPTDTHGMIPIGLALLALLIIFGGFGGLLVRYQLSFLGLGLFFVTLALGAFFCGRLITRRLQTRLGERGAAIIGACVSMLVVLLVNTLAFTIHTLALNPISHALYMQGRIAGTPYNALLIGTVLQVLLLLICIISIVFALRRPTPQRIMAQ